MTLEKLFLSIALVQRAGPAGTRCLLKADGEPLGFVQGPRLGRESFRETAIRETGWQLNLDPRSEFLVSSLALLSMEYVGVIPGDPVQRHIAVAFYPVKVYRQQVLDRLDSDPAICWVSMAEICAGRTNENRVIDPRVVAWINQWEVIRPWQ